jgi:hypothetical protein
MLPAIPRARQRAHCHCVACLNGGGQGEKEKMSKSIGMMNEKTRQQTCNEQVNKTNEKMASHDLPIQTVPMGDKATSSDPQNTWRQSQPVEANAERRDRRLKSEPSRGSSEEPTNQHDNHFNHVITHDKRLVHEQVKGKKGKTKNGGRSVKSKIATSQVISKRSHQIKHAN